MTKLGGASNQPTNPNLTGYPGDLKFPGRCGRYFLQFTPIVTKILFVCLLPGRRSPRLTVTWKGS